MTTTTTTTMTFAELPISKEIQRAIADLGFEMPSPIQKEAIPKMLEGKDIIGQAQTGTGKTAAFAIPLLDKIDPTSDKVQALILAPTRELAIQVAEEIRKLAKYKHGIKILAVYGGQPIDRQIRGLKGVQLVIGTPGRLQDHMERRTIKLANVKMVVLDEADEMLDMGFVEDIENILKATPADRQTVLFSATMPREILDLSKKYLRNAETVKVVHEKLTVPSIEQYYLEVKQNAKLEVLTRLLDMEEAKLSVVFAKTKRGVDELIEALQARGYGAEGIHGDMRQTQRDSVMRKFRAGQIEILVATDVAARGIDVEDIEAVYNYDIPQDEEYYVHRIGRTGRAGRKGRSYTFVTGREMRILKDIERYTKTKIQRRDIPSMSDVEERRQEIFAGKVKEVIDANNLTKYKRLAEKLIDDHNSLDVVAALMKMVLNEEDVDSERDELDISDTGMVRLFINLGRNNNIMPKDVVGAIAGTTGIPGKLLGAIDIHDKYTFVEVPRAYAYDVLNRMKSGKIKGQKVNIEEV
jgi:ATP-dependent RNA helicase DeaD